MLSKKIKKIIFKTSLRDELKEIARHLKELFHQKKLVPILIPARSSKRHPNLR